MSNTSLQEAKRAKNDEFYTLYEDVEEEVVNYRDQFKGKVVYCNCDNANSNFVRYFTEHKEDFGILDLQYSGFTNGDGEDFRSPEAIEKLRKSDIVITNPPFSLFREFIDLMMRENKKFLVIGNENAITYKEIFPLIKENKLWLGVHHVKQFMTPTLELKKFGNVCWFTDMQNGTRYDWSDDWRGYKYCMYRGNESRYPKYDNYDAINVDKLSEVPVDYDGVMGVPITILGHYCPDEFEILGISEQCGKGLSGGVRTRFDLSPNPMINGEPKYVRVFIRRKF